MRLLLDSRNPNKLRELRAALPLWELELLDTPDEPVEDGATFVDNARIKARHGRLHAPSEAWVAGEDSGIEVAALDGRPGVESARWATDGVGQLLTELGGAQDRTAIRVTEIRDGDGTPGGVYGAVDILAERHESGRHVQSEARIRGPQNPDR